MLEVPIEIATRVVLIEKAPFWVRNRCYGFKYLVRACVSEDELIGIKRDESINISKLYIISEGIEEGRLMYKAGCKRISK